MMPMVIYTIVSVAIVLTLVSGCDGRTIDDNWPTYEVRGSVRTTGGVPVTGVLVELETWGEAGCGAGSLIALSWDETDFQGRYAAQQDEPAGTLSGCLRLVAHPDTSGLSQPTATIDLPVHNVRVIEGETVFTVDLTVP
jgi:hypothetical protein